jgi:hypothetical protein
MQASLQAAACWYGVGEYEKALRVYDGVAARTPDPGMHATALAGAVRCLVALQQPNEMRRRLALLKEAIPRLDGRVRPAWERWLAESEKVLTRFWR